MIGKNQFNQDDVGITFRDVLFLAMMGFVAIIILLIPHINPKGQKDEIDIKQQGNVIAQCFWEDGIDADIDMWMQAPKGVPVGYSNKGTSILNLLRDDLGTQFDATDKNQEVIASRGIYEGYWYLNVHWFRRPGNVGVPLKVRCTISVKPTLNDSAKQILATSIFFSREGEEITVFRFYLNKKGELVSYDSQFKPLRALSGGRERGFGG